MAANPSLPFAPLLHISLLNLSFPSGFRLIHIFRDKVMIGQYLFLLCDLTVNQFSIIPQGKFSIIVDMQMNFDIGGSDLFQLSFVMKLG